MSQAILRMLAGLDATRVMIARLRAGPLVGEEPARGHLERPGLCFHVGQPGRGVDLYPVVDGVEDQGL
jgi:hypothetical protein